MFLLSVIASGAKQSKGDEASLNCFVVSLLAMTLLPSSAVSSLTTNSMTPEVMDFRAPKSALAAALRARLLQRLRRRLHRHMPDILRIFADGAIGGKPRHPRDVENGGSGPGWHHLPARVDATLGGVVGIAIGTDHVMV